MRRFSGTLLTGLAFALGACATASLDFGNPGDSPGGPGVSAQAGIESATVRWEAVTGATSYVIYVQPTGGTAVAVPVLGGGGTFSLVAGLEGGRVHGFRVAALQGGSEIDSSAVVSAAPIRGGHGGLAPRTVPAWTSSGGGASFRFGFPLSAAGDVDGDGYDDVLVGANLYTGGASQEGAAFLFRGTPAGLETVNAWSVESNQAFAHFGKGLAAAGDVNDDGNPDVVLAAPDFDAGESAEGRAWLYEGDGVTYDDTIPSWTWDSNQAQAYTGRHVGAAGDVNSDGVDDLVVSVHGWDAGFGGATGQVHVFHGSASGLGLAPAATMRSEEDGSAFGYSTSARRGDVNGDGADDVLVGAYLQDCSLGARLDCGKVFLFNGRPLGLTTTASWSYAGSVDAERTGVEVEIVGDVNGDGFDDLVVGADGAGGGAGRALMFLGSTVGPRQTPDWIVEGTQAAAGFGSDVAGAGDVNGDGYDDVVVGAYRWNAPADDAGRAWIYLGGPSGLSEAPSWDVSGPAARAFFGGALSTAGDVNGDGAEDVLVGSTGFEGTAVPVGRAWLYLGAPPAGPAVDAGAAADATVGAPFSLLASGFTASAAGAPFSCVVGWGDGSADTIDACSTSALRAAAHVYTSADARLVRVRVTNAFGVRGEGAVTVTAR